MWLLHETGIFSNSSKTNIQCLLQKVATDIEMFIDTYKYKKTSFNLCDYLL